MAFAFPAAGKWLSRLTGLTILFLSIAVVSGEGIHRSVLETGEEHWDEYFLLRGAGAIQAPDCDRNPDIAARTRETIREKKMQMKDDPLAEVLGTTVNEAAVRKEILGAREICREKWRRYETVQNRLTPGLIAYSTVDRNLAGAVTFIGNNRRSLLALIIFLCAAVSTFQRRHISVLPIETQRDHWVHSIAMVLTNGFLFGAAMAHHLEWQETSRASGEPSLGVLWMAAFALLTLAGIYRLLSPPRNLIPDGSPGKALLCIPLFSLLCLLASFSIFSQGVHHATSIFLGVAQEGLASLLLQFLLATWIAVWLVNRVETSTPRERSGTTLHNSLP